VPCCQFIFCFFGDAGVADEDQRCWQLFFGLWWLLMLFGWGAISYWGRFSLALVVLVRCTWVFAVWLCFWLVRE